MTVTIGRRELLAALGGAAAAWPHAARAQSAEQMRRIGLMTGLAPDDPESLRRLTAFVQGLEHLGWNEGRNLSTAVRFGAGDAVRLRKYAEELVAMAPDGAGPSLECVALAGRGSVKTNSRPAT